MLVKIHDLDMTGLKIVNLVKSLFFGQHRIITCCLLSESFQNQSQFFWADSAPPDVLPLNLYGIVAILQSTRKRPSWQNIWQESCRDRCIQSSLGTSREFYRVSEDWKHLLGAECTTALEKPALCHAVSLLDSSSQILVFFSLPVPIKDDESHHGLLLLSGGRVSPQSLLL